MEKNEIDSYVKAGEIAKGVKVFARSLIKPGVKLIDVAEAVDAKIVELGGEAAFPVNLSLNEIAAHYTPVPGDETKAEGILKVDIGVAVDGYIADTAFSVDLTKNNEFEEMISLNEKILSDISDRIFSRVGEVGRGKEKISKSVDFDGMRVYEVGDVAQDTLEAWNASRGGKFAIIRSLSGHALGRDKIHAGLVISNYRNENKSELKDMAFAIEPFVTSGVGDIYEGAPGGIYVLQDDKPVRDRDAREVLRFIKEKYKTRPFCLRWLVRAMGDGGWGMERVMTVNKLKFVLSLLVKQGVLHEYPLLIEKSKAPVSQFENTFVVGDGGVVRTTG